MKLYHEIAGQGHPVILIAGYASDLTQWDLVRPILSSHFQLILIDNRCVGRSPCPNAPFTLDDLATDVVELIDKLHLQQPHVIGSSMGSCITQILAHRYPKKIDKIVLAHTFWRSTPVAKASLGFGIHLRESGAPLRLQAEAILPWIFSNNFIDNPQTASLFFDAVEKNPYPPSLEGMKRQFEALSNFNSSAWLSQIKKPTLVICGDEDLFCPMHETLELTKQIPHAKLHVFKRSAHAAALEHPDEFSQAVLKFLKE